MAKKQKKRSRWLWALWGLVLFAGVSLFFMPIDRPTPKVRWRAPVHVVMPDFTKALPQSLPDMPDVDFPDVNMSDVRKFGDKVTDALPDLPALPYEAPPVFHEEDKPAEPVPESKKDEPAVVLPQPAAEEAHEPPKRGPLRIALIIDDMGLVSHLSERAVRLPSAVTLAYLPYAPRLIQQAEAAIARGHDLLLHLPMEPVGNENPGPGALLSNHNEQEWRVLVDQALRSFDGFVGVNNHMGSKLTLNADAMRVVGEQLKERGMFFVDSRTNSKSIAEQAIRGLGVPVTGRDVFLDDTQTSANVWHELNRAEQVARRRGQAVVIGHPHAVTLQALEQWIPQAQARGVVLVHVRDLVR